MSTYWLVLQAILFESLGIAALFSDQSSFAKFTAFATSHGIACGILSLVLWRLLPKRYRSPALLTLGFVFSFQFLIPMVGSAGLFSALLLALYLPRTNRQDPWKSTAFAELPYKALDFDQFPIYSHGGLIQILKDAADPNKRLKAVMSSKQMPEKASIQLLRFALKDPVDDVRLLAYSMLDEKEKKLNESVSHNLAVLERISDPEQIHQVQQLIASFYWEMVYLDIVQGGVRTHVLSQARQFIEQALEFKASVSALKLYGRILLTIGDLSEAKLAFERAIHIGLPADVASPFLAEIAFLDREFPLIQNYLTIYRNTGKSSPSFQPVLSYWLDGSVNGAHTKQ